MIAVVTIAAAAAVFAVVSDDRPEAPPAPSDGPTPASAVTGDRPAAPWGESPVPRSDVPPAYVTAWDRARNHDTCGLLFPLDGGPVLEDARATEERTPGDNGWDIFLAGKAGTLEVLGLFDKETQADPRGDNPGFTKTWPDGSVARYHADAGNLAPDPGSSPFEAVLTLPDHSCAYRIYDTLGKDHLEFTFDRLRLMGP